MINDFLIINCIGEDDKLGLRINKEFFVYKYEKKEISRESLVFYIQNFLKSHKIFICGRIFKIQKPQKMSQPQEYIHIWDI
mgnify:CR=1 FL=1